MAWLALIKSALDGLSAIPKILSQITAWQVEARVAALEARERAVRDAFTRLTNAKTKQETQDAVNELADRWNHNTKPELPSS